MAALFLFLGTPPASGQENGGSGDIVVLADVSVEECSLSPSANTPGEYQVRCTFVNNYRLQPDIRYGLSLYQRSGDDRFVVAEQAFSRSFTLREGERVTEEMRYAVPPVLEGDFDLVISLGTSTGLPLAEKTIGTIRAEKRLPGLEILFPTCLLRIDGEVPEQRYTPDQGVDIDADELLTAHCQVHNPGPETIE